MTTLDELNLQNHKLTELSNVLVYLLQERSMCDTDTACNLLFSFLELFEEHMSLVDSLYKGLLLDKERETNVTAEMFMSGEQELKRILKQYSTKWCKRKSHQLRVLDHDEFTKDTQQLFDIVLTRIQNETERLYPLVREMQQFAA